MKYFYFYSHFPRENKEIIFTIIFLCKQYTLKTNTTDFLHNLSERNLSFATKSSKIRSFSSPFSLFKLFATCGIVKANISKQQQKSCTDSKNTLRQIFYWVLRPKVAYLLKTVFSIWFRWIFENLSVKLGFCCLYMYICFIYSYIYDCLIGYLMICSFPYMNIILGVVWFEDKVICFSLW